MAGRTILINVNTNKDLGGVAKVVAEEISPEGGTDVSIMSDKSLPKGEGVAVELFESEGTEPLTVETRFRVER